MAPDIYEQYFESDSAIITLNPSKGERFTAFTYKKNAGCTDRLQLAESEGFPRKMRTANAIQPGVPFVMTYAVIDKAVFFCSATIRFIPESNQKYILSSMFTGKNYCMFSLKDIEGNPVPLEFSDDPAVGTTEESPWCENAEFSASDGDFETDKYQDGFEARLLKRKE